MVELFSVHTVTGVISPSLSGVLWLAAVHRTLATTTNTAAHLYNKAKTYRVRVQVVDEFGHSAVSTLLSLPLRHIQTVPTFPSLLAILFRFAQLLAICNGEITPILKN